MCLTTRKNSRLKSNINNLILMIQSNKCRPLKLDQSGQTKIVRLTRLDQKLLD